MIKRYVFISLLTCFQASAITPFVANYKVYKSGKEIGTSSMELANRDGKYVMEDKTDGTHGMASFLGFKRSEVTVFDETDGIFVPENYQMKQKVAFNKRQSAYAVSEKSIAGKHKDKSWSLDLPKNEYSTPNLVKLNLARDICNGKQEPLSYEVVDGGKVKVYQFEITSTANNIIEVSKQHSNKNRITKTWLDKDQQCLPVKTYHIEEGEDPIETKLIGITLN